MDEAVTALIAIMEDVAAGNYSDKIIDFTRPDHPEHIQRIAEAMAMMMVKIEAREMRLEMLVNQLRELNQQLKANIVQTVSVMANTLAARDKYTEGHARRVSEYAARLAQRLKLPEEEVEHIRIGGVLHDLGKIGFSDRIFQNEDIRVPQDMLDEIRRHPDIGARIIKDLEFLSSVSDCILYHHERVDGTGYPYGLKGDDIPLSARILAVADCYDAMTTNRPYQKAKKPREAFAALRKIAGSALSPDLVELFIEEMEKSGFK